ncbi:MAG: sugar porter family MFS transporter [Chitinophagales bacterium]|nr:sugar porter family MFS transporter [Chitinophagales bacterium]
MNNSASGNNTSYIVMISMIVALGGFLMGFDASVISGVVKFIEPEFNLTKIELGWAVSCLTLTATLAMMLAGPLSDRIGRKKVLTFAAILYAISAILSAFAPSFWLLIAARMIGGLGVGASLILAPMYIAEISPPNLRGRMVSFNQLNIVVGISVAFFTNYLILKLSQSDLEWARSMKFDIYQWRWMLGLETLPAILYFFALYFVPKSPRWLAMKGKFDEALQIMTKAVGPEEANKEIDEIKASITSETNLERVPIKKLLDPTLRTVLIIGLVIGILQQITGINSVFFYAPVIFEQSGIGTDASFSQAIMVGLINLVFTIVAILLIDRIGRKPLLIMGVSGIILSMFLLAYGFGSATYTITEDTVSKLPAEIDRAKIVPMTGVAYDSDLSFKSALVENFGEEDAKKFESAFINNSISMNPLLVLLGVLAFVASFAVSLGPVMWVLFSELFPNWIRGLAISFVGLANSAVSFLVQLVFPWELANFGNSTTFLIYGVFAVFGLIFIIFKVPETKGKSLEELEKILVK